MELMASIGDYYHELQFIKYVFLLKPKPKKMTIKLSKVVCCIGIIMLIISCKDSNEYTTVDPSETIKNKSHETHKVIVKEFENAGMYTYVKVEENNNQFWIAIPNTKIEIGQTYFYHGGTKMVNFKSQELNKTFDEVYFVEALRGHMEKSPNKNVDELIAQPKNGIAIKDLLANVNDFSKKEVIVKGKVVKVNRNILDKNWVHLRDGTNFNDKANLTFTTQDTVKVGDIVTFKGVLTLNKDFGYGYVYPVIIEESKLVK